MVLGSSSRYLSDFAKGLSSCVYCTVRNACFAGTSHSLLTLTPFSPPKRQVDRPLITAAFLLPFDSLPQRRFSFLTRETLREANYRLTETT